MVMSRVALESVITKEIIAVIILVCLAIYFAFKKDKKVDDKSAIYLNILSTLRYLTLINDYAYNEHTITFDEYTTNRLSYNELLNDLEDKFYYDKYSKGEKCL